MQVKKVIGGIIGVIASLTFLATTAGGVSGAQTNGLSLDQVITQEAVQQTTQAFDQQKYDDIKKMFDKANTVTLSTVKESGFELNKFYGNSVCTTYVMKDNIPFKFNGSFYGSTYRENSYRITDKNTGSPLDIQVAYKGVLPDAQVKEDVLAAAKADNATLTTDAQTPILKNEETVILFLENLKVAKGSTVSRLGLIGYLPATKENKALIENIVSEYKK